MDLTASPPPSASKRADHDKGKPAIFLHLLIALAYLGLAAAVLLLGPRYAMVLIDPVPLFMLLAVVIVLLGIILHAGVVLRARIGRQSRQFSALHREVKALRSGIEIALQKLETLEGTSPPDSEPGRDLNEVVAEVRVLQSLIEELWTKREASAGHADDTAETAEAEILPPKQKTRQAVLAGRESSTDDPMLSAREILEIVREGLRNNRIELMMQPIVTLPQRRVAHYECLSRIRTKSGLLITPSHYIGLAEEEGLIGAIDNMTLFRLVQHVRRHRPPAPDGRFFCNISIHSLADAGFFKQFLEFLTANASLSKSIVFEFSQANFPAVGDVARDNMLSMAAAGYRFSLDHVENLDIDPEEYAALGFKFLKIESGLLLSYAEHEPPLLDIGLLKGALDRVAIDLIVDKVESEALLLRVLDHPIDFGQGYLFGGPQVDGKSAR
ncbi:MAG: EAL domain-containing protein [Alphaproteobacteria bacterium]|nr:EAL domain-containing protein [Alphaproteobacteria bacterium]